MKFYKKISEDDTTLIRIWKFLIYITRLSSMRDFTVYWDSPDRPELIMLRVINNGLPRIYVGGFDKFKSIFKGDRAVNNKFDLGFTNTIELSFGFDSYQTNLGIVMWGINIPFFSVYFPIHRKEWIDRDYFKLPRWVTFSC